MDFFYRYLDNIIDITIYMAGLWVWLGIIGQLSFKGFKLPGLFLWNRLAAWITFIANIILWTAIWIYV